MRRARKGTFAREGILTLTAAPGCRSASSLRALAGNGPREVTSRGVFQILFQFPGNRPGSLLARSKKRKSLL